MNFYQHHIGDYDSHTAHLTWHEDAAYRRLMCLYYRTEKPIPADVKQACRLIRAHSEQEREAVQQVLGEFFTLQDDGWHNVRCDEEIAKAQAKAEHNRRVGKLGGRHKQNGTQVVPEKEPSGNPGGFQTEPKQNPDGFQTEPKQNPIQTPDSRLQTPRTRSQTPERVVAADATTPANDSQPKSAATWNAYRDAYLNRYGVEPVRNAKVSKQLCTLVERIGITEAPEVASFFVNHNASYYVQRGHAADCLLADAEKLRTEWITGRQMTATRAQQIDKTQTNYGAFADLIAEAEAREAAYGK